MRRGRAVGHADVRKSPDAGRGKSRRLGSSVGTCQAEYVIFETERLQLVPLGPDRAEQLAEVYADPGVSRYVGGDSLTVASTREQAAWFEQVWHERGYGQSAVIERATGHLIGRIGLSFWPEWDEVELGYVLCRAAQGRGLALEGCQPWIEWASAHLLDSHLIAVIHPDNVASIRLAQRVGFNFDRREHARGIDVVVYRLELPA